MRQFGVVVAVAVVASIVGACVPSSKEVCDALRATPEGLEEVTSQGGEAVDRASWFTVLTTGVLAADPASRDEVAAAVAADTAGFDRIVAAAPEVEVELRLLRDLAADAATGATMSSAPDTVQAAAVVSDFVGDECDD
jgi:hypothetical protein